MSKVVVVTSGKGGVGKTTTTANIATGLALKGYKTAAVDFDVGLRNLDLVLGCERRVVYDFVNVIKGEAKLHQALIRDKRIDTLHVLAASQTRDKDALDAETRLTLANRKDEITTFLRQAEALADPKSTIVPIRRQGYKPPIFAVSGHGGESSEEQTSPEISANGPVSADPSSPRRSARMEPAGARAHRAGKIGYAPTRL